MFENVIFKDKMSAYDTLGEYEASMYQAYDILVSVYYEGNVIIISKFCNVTSGYVSK